MTRTATLFSQACRRPRSAGFTLLELVLVVGLLMLMISSVGFYVAPWLTGAGTEAQASQFAGALRFARAEAAYLGKTIRLTLEPEPMQDTPAGSTMGTAEQPPEQVRYRVVVSYEAQPLESPGAFEPLVERAWIDQLDDLTQVMVVQAERVGPDAEALNQLAAQDQQQDPQTQPVHLMFYPNGSSESARLVLAPTDARDQRRAVVTLTGLIGKVALTWTDQTGLEQEEDEAMENPLAELDDDPV